MKYYNRMPQLISMLMVLALISACQTIDLDIQQIASMAKKAQTLSDTSEKEEVAIGRESTAVLLGALGQKPVYEKVKVQKYVNLIGNHVAQFSKRSTLKWHFVISNDPDINAFAAPGGYIIVTLGLLAELETEAQLAAVIAHEIAHVEAKHHLQVMKKNGFLALASDVAMIAYSSGDNEPRLNPKVAQKILDATRTLYARGLDKEDEFVADKRAMQLLALAGYDPYALIDVLQILDSKSESDSKLALMFKTHPTPRARIDQLAGITLAGSGQVLKQRFNQYLQ